MREIDHLIGALTALQPLDAKEAEDVERILNLLRTDGMDAFDRRHFTPGHVTGSALLFNVDQTKMLLTHHMVLDKWLQLGGHADGEADILGVAMREAREESGCQSVVPVSLSPIHVDVHTFPAKPHRDEPEHLHFDIRYILKLDHEEAVVVSEESHDVRWFDAQNLDGILLDPSVRRLVDKWGHIKQSLAA